MLNDDKRTVLAVTDKISADFLKTINEKGKEIIVCPSKNKKVDLGYLMKELWKMGIDSVLIEGGSTLNYSAFSEGIVDKVISFIAPAIVGGAKAPTSVEGEGVEKIGDAIKLIIDKVERIDKDVLIIAYPEIKHNELLK